VTEYSSDAYNGLTFGPDGVDGEYYPLIETPGFDGVGLDGGRLDGGVVGIGSAALASQPRTWTTSAEIIADTTANWQTKRDALAAATTKTQTYREYVSTRGGQVRTVFARVRNRDIPRDEQSDVRHYAVASIQFEATDTTVYGPLEVETLTGGTDDVVVDSAGWVDSWRWIWRVDGPATNPQLASSLSAAAIVRYVGTVPDGSSLVVELLPVGQVPGYYAKIIDTVDVADYRTAGVPAYSDLDGTTGKPPRWFPISPGEQTIGYSSTDGTDGCTFTWRPGFD